MYQDGGVEDYIVQVYVLQTIILIINSHNFSIWTYKNNKTSRQILKKNKNEQET